MVTIDNWFNHIHSMNWYTDHWFWLLQQAEALKGSFYQTFYRTSYRIEGVDLMNFNDNNDENNGCIRALLNENCVMCAVMSKKVNIIWMVFLAMKLKSIILNWSL